MSSEGSSCPACGAPLKPGARFCGACGCDTTSSGADVMPAEALLPDTPPPVCGRCGQALKQDARFCPGCGTPFETAIARPAASPNGRLGPMLVTGVSLLVLVVAAGALAVIAWGRWGPEPGDARPAAATAPRPSPPQDAVPAAQAPAPSPTMEAAPTETVARREATADPAATDAAAAAGRDARRSRRSTAPARAPARTPSTREAAPAPSAPPPAADVLCIRPDGSETRTSRANCRAQGGVIY